MKVILNGGGRMAASIRDVVGHDVEIGGVASPNRPGWLGAEPWARRLDGLGVEADVVIDFSLPDGTAAAADWCRRHGVPLVSGVTGLGDDHFTALDRAAEEIPVLWAPNLSLGVNLLESLLRIVAKTLDPATPVKIHDVHHQWKKDAPSGTALALGRAVESMRAADAPLVQYSSEREGEVVGRHRIRFEMKGEVLELAHEALDRAIFARGAVDAACWLHRQPPGRYGAGDWLAGR